MAEEKKPSKNKTKTAKDIASKQSWLIKGGLIVLTIMLLAGAGYGYLYTSTPAHLRDPEFEHYHLRTQIIVDGQSVDFSHDEFQEDYDATSCSAELTGQPIDFHDNQDQLAHVHWRGTTGGEFLKFFGWNLIGGDDGTLGRRYDQGMMRMHNIDTAGELLPALPDDANLYVYIGDKDSYTRMDWDDFLYQDLEDFIGKKSNLDNDDITSFNVLDLFTQKAYAHGDEADEAVEPAEGENDEQRLERINNLIGNVVIFAQAGEPTDEQIQARFNNLVPLHDSVCGG